MNLKISYYSNCICDWKKKKLPLHLQVDLKSEVGLLSEVCRRLGGSNFFNLGAILPLLNFMAGHTCFKSVLYTLL